MPKVTAPLLSFEARGQIAKTQVYSSWKGRPYVRRYVIPANPNSAAQQLTRTAFAFCNGVYKFAPSDMTDAWDAYAQGQVLTGRNAFIKQNLPLLRTAADLDNMIGSPGARGGFAPASMVLTPGDDQMTATLTAPSLPAGWTIVEGIAIAVAQQDPNTGTDYQVFSATDAADPYAPVITGLADATDYAVSGWFTYLRPDGITAYGRSLTDSAVTT